MEVDKNTSFRSSEVSLNSSKDARLFNKQQNDDDILDTMIQESL